MTDLRTLPILPLAPGAKKPALADAGERPELLWVPVRDLRVDAGYQRALLDKGRRLARAIALGWDWNLVGVLTVAEIGGGRFEVIDGQHRAVAALARGDIHHLPALRARCATVADRARTFAALNTVRVAVTATQRLRAGLAGFGVAGVTAPDIAPDREDGLTATETRVLRALQDAAGRTLDAHALGAVAVASEGALKVHLCRIRQRRPDLGARIETWHGRGYRWAPAGEAR